MQGFGGMILKRVASAYLLFLAFLTGSAVTVWACVLIVLFARYVLSFAGIS
jgi:hypothetical protein